MKDGLFDKIFEGLKHSIERSRFATTLLIIACVLSSIAYWNGKENSWARSRLDRYLLLSQLNSLYQQEIVKDSTLSEFRVYLLAKQNPAVHDLDGLLAKTPIDTLYSRLRSLRRSGAISDSLFERAAVPWISTDFVDFLEVKRNVVTPSQADALRQAVADLPDAKDQMAFAQDGFEQTRRAYINGTLSIDLPFFGLAFDINDLALLSGLGFTLLLLAISFNVYREHHNLRSLLDWVACMPDRTNTERCLRLRVYQAAANLNVLTVPPEVMGCNKCREEGLDQFRRGQRKMFLVLSRVLYLLPVTLHYSIWRNDTLTQAHGFALEPDRMAGLTNLSTFFLISISVFTAIALFSVIRVESLWVTFAGKVRPLPGQDPTLCEED